MSSGEFDFNAIGLDNSVSLATDSYSMAESKFFQASFQVMRNPYTEQFQHMQSTVFELQDSFGYFAGALAQDKGIEALDRAQDLAKLLIRTNDDRGEFFSKIAPEGKFNNATIDRDVLAEYFATILDKDDEKRATDPDDLDPTEIVENVYGEGLCLDVAELLNIANSNFRAKNVEPIGRNELLLRRAAEFGKSTTGIALGAFIVGYMLKRSTGK